jgi:hypothetical protein
VHLLERTGCLTLTENMTVLDIACFHLGGTCYANCGMWKECLALIHPSGLHDQGGSTEDEMNYLEHELTSYWSESGGNGDGGGAFVLTDDPMAAGIRFELLLRTIAFNSEQQNESESESEIEIESGSGSGSSSTSSSTSSSSSSSASSSSSKTAASSSSASAGALGRVNHASSMIATLYLLRGRGYEESDNRERAIMW